MKAVTVTPGGGVASAERPVPMLAAGQVRVRVAYGGICGSDLHYAQNGRNGIYTVTEPMVLGHEVAGVVDVSESAAVPVGSRVAVHPATPTPPPGGATGHGLHLADGGTYLGSASTTPHTDGGFSEFVVVDDAQIRHLPAQLPLRRAALAEPLAVAVHAVNRVQRPLADARILVAGAGPIGCLTIAALRAAGAAHITALDLLERPLAVASTVGADRTVQLGADPEPDPESFDVVIESSGSPRSLTNAVSWVKRGGTIVQLGLLPAGDISVSLAGLVSKEVTLHGSQRFDVELDEAVSILAAVPELDEIISHVFPAERAAEAFAVAADPSLSGKVLIGFGADPDVPRP